MYKQPRYPQLGIRSKNELAKRISSKELPLAFALQLINDVLANFDSYWYDSAKSEPEKEKYVRSAVNNPLGRLLKLIDKKVLAPNDSLVPNFVFGGISGKDHIKAAHHLLGKRRRRTLLRLDITRFFEQIRKQRVFYLFYSKFGCSKEASSLIARLCCVPLGPKGKGAQEESIARGFATSPRLSLWCNMDSFIRLEWAVKEKLKGYDPRIAIFVDDIGVMASRVDKSQMEELSAILEEILVSDPNQKLRINEKKKEILGVGATHHLGLKLGAKKLSLGGKSLAKRAKIRKGLKTADKTEKASLLRRNRGYKDYEKQIAKTQDEVRETKI